MLPNQVNPLLIFMGVSTAPATRSSSWTPRSRRPARASASPATATARSSTWAPGSEQEFTDEDGDSYRLRIDEIRKVKVGDESSDRAPPLQEEQVCARRGRGIGRRRAASSRRS